RGSRLPQCLARAVEAERIGVTASDRGEDGPRSRIEQDERAFEPEPEPACGLELAEPAREQPFGVGLPGGIQRREYAQAFLGRSRRRDAARDLVTHERGERGIAIEWRRRMTRAQWSRARLARGGRIDDADGDEIAEHAVARAPRQRGIAER